MSTAMQDALRRVADLLDAHPSLPTPFVTIYSHRPDRPELAWYLHIDQENDEFAQKSTAAIIIKTLGGKWDKDFIREASFRQTRDGIDLQVSVKREAVCQRIVTGTETVTIPAVDAQPERTETVEIVEWDCGSLLGEAVSA